MATQIDALYPIAEAQDGYLTAAQSTAADVPLSRLSEAVADGRLERVSRGVYRLARFPVTEHAPLREAVLWPQVRRVVPVAISHDSALALLGMSEVSPATIHITIPPNFRIRRAVPARFTLHHAPLPAEELMLYEGLPVTTPPRALRAAAAAGLAPGLVRQAILDGSRRGLLTLATARDLAHELLGEQVLLDVTGMVASIVPSYTERAELSRG